MISVYKLNHVKVHFILKQIRYYRVTDKFIELCNKNLDSKGSRISVHFRSLKNLVENPNFSQVIFILSLILKDSYAFFLSVYDNVFDLTLMLFLSYFKT